MKSLFQLFLIFVGAVVIMVVIGQVLGVGGAVLGCAIYSFFVGMKLSAPKRDTSLKIGKPAKRQ